MKNKTLIIKIQIISFPHHPWGRNKGRCVFLKRYPLEAYSSTNKLNKQITTQVRPLVQLTTEAKPKYINKQITTQVRPRPNQSTLTKQITNQTDVMPHQAPFAFDAASGTIRKAYYKMYSLMPVPVWPGPRHLSQYLWCRIRHHSQDSMDAA